jgi:hypothetical protein
MRPTIFMPTMAFPSFILLILYASSKNPLYDINYEDQLFQ